MLRCDRGRIVNHALKLDDKLVDKLVYKLVDDGESWSRMVN